MLFVVTALRLTGGKGQPALFDSQLVNCWLQLLPFCHFALALSPVTTMGDGSIYGKLETRWTDCISRFSCLGMGLLAFHKYRNVLKEGDWFYFSY
jgi:hypothetical protein